MGLLLGLGGLWATITVSWGLVGSGTKRVRQARARLAYHTTRMDPARGLAVTPWATAFLLGYSASALIPGASKDGLLLLVSVVGLLVGALAFWRPGQFLPRWFRETERRRAAGLPLGIETPPEGSERMPVRPRELWFGFGLLAAGLVLGVVLGFSPAWFAALFMGGGQALTLYGSDR